MSIADQLTSLANTKAAIKTAIEAKGVTVGSVAFDQYPSKISAITGGGSTVEDWVRPSDWLQNIRPDGTTQKVVGLFAVFNGDDNYVSFAARGAYTVDWGDGSPLENYADNTQCQHKYTFSNISSSTTTSEGYRQVVITITPQAGQNLSVIFFQRNHTDIGTNTTPSKTNWLELYAATSHADVLAGLANWMTGKTLMPFLKAVYILPCNTVVNNAINSTMFRGQAEYVEYVEISRPNVVITGSGPLQYCRLVKRFNLHSTIAATTSFANFFNTCSSLVEVPSINWAVTGVSDFSAMFYGCSSLRAIPELNTTSGTNFSQMFYGCSAIKTIPALNTTSGTNFFQMFYGCNALQNIPTLNTSKGGNFSYMFQSCTSLREVPSISFAADTTTALTNTFASCSSLSSFKATGISLSFSVANCFLSATALNEIYTNLPTVTGKTITVTGNYGAAASDITIATAKGWTVTR